MNFRNLRKLCNLSQKKMAELMGVPTRTYEDWERGIASPPVYVQKMLEEFIKDYIKKEETKAKIKNLSSIEREYAELTCKLLDVLIDGTFDTPECKKMMEKFSETEFMIAHCFAYHSDKERKTHIIELRKIGASAWVDVQKENSKDMDIRETRKNGIIAYSVVDNKSGENKFFAYTFDNDDEGEQNE